VTIVTGKSNHLPESIDAVVVGAGQAGLATGYHLRHSGIDHVILHIVQTIDARHRSRTLAAVS
jgi:putative flavoprotein involved in K+ transport